MRLTLSLEEFASQRRKVQTDVADFIGPHVGTLWTPALANAVLEAFSRLYEEEAGEPYVQDANFDIFLEQVRTAYLEFDEGTPAGVKTLMITTATINAATVFAARADDAELFLVWVSM